jgi:monofunctional glycosyltransferase
MRLRWIAWGAAGTLAGLLLYLAAGLPWPSEVRSLATTNPGRTSLMRQREAEAQARGRKPRVVQSWIPLERVSRRLIQAVVASEDQKFFGHEGVDWAAIQDSMETNVKKGRAARGGSTITQQLAKNLFFDTRKSVTRKVRELVVTRWMEQELTKRRILALYLNVIEWGDGIYGCEAAARAYFGKSAADLSVEEAAGLAAMIPNPRRIHPRVSPARYARARRRVLWLMATAGYIAREVAGLGSEPPPELDPSELEEPPGEVPVLPEAPPTPPETPAAGASPTPGASPESVPSPPAESPWPPAEPPPVSPTSTIPPAER